MNKFLSLGSFFFVLLSCSTSSVEKKNAISASYGSFSTTILKPFFLNQGDQQFALYYRLGSMGSHGFDISLRNSKTIALAKEGKLASEYYSLFSNSSGRKDYSKRELVTLAFTIPARYAVDECNTLFVNHSLLSKNGTSYSIKEKEAFSLNVWGMRGVTYKAELYQDGALSRGYPTESHYWVNGKNYVKPFSLEHKGFRSSFENPSSNRLPISDALLRSVDCEGKAIPFAYGRAFLTLSGDISSIEVGEKVELPSGTLLRFEMDFVKAVNMFYRPSLKTALYVSPDGRYMRDEEHKLPGDVQTKDIFLPPVESNRPISITMTLSVEKCGDCSMDAIEYVSTVYKSANYVGSCAISKWCLGEE